MPLIPRYRDERSFEKEEKENEAGEEEEEEKERPERFSCHGFMLALSLRDQELIVIADSPSSRYRRAIAVDDIGGLFEETAPASPPPPALTADIAHLASFLRDAFKASSSSRQEGGSSSSSSAASFSLELEASPDGRRLLLRVACVLGERGGWGEQLVVLATALHSISPPPPEEQQEQQRNEAKTKRRSDDGDENEPTASEQFFALNPVEHLLSAGTPVFLSPAVVPLSFGTPPFRQEAAVHTDNKSFADRGEADSFAARHGIVVDVRTEGIFPYYLVQRTTGCVECGDRGGGDDNDDGGGGGGQTAHYYVSNQENDGTAYVDGEFVRPRLEIVAVAHRDLVGQEHYLTCPQQQQQQQQQQQGSSSGVGGARLCEYCTGARLHPVIALDVLPTPREVALLLSLPTFSCQCGAPLLRSSPRDAELSAGGVRMTTPLLGGSRRRSPCCSIECAVRYSRGGEEPGGRRTSSA